MDDIALAKEGDRAAFGRLVAAQQNHLWALAHSIVRDGALAEDIAQEAFVRAWRTLGELRDEGALVGWLRQITRRLALDAWRERKRRGALTAEVAAPATDALERKETLAFVDAALAALDEDEREILIAHLREELSLRELAARLGVSEQVAQKRLSRARLKLQKEAEARLAIGLRKIAPGATFVLAVFAAIEAQASSALPVKTFGPGMTAGIASTALAGVALAVFFAFSARHSVSPSQSRTATTAKVTMPAEPVSTISMSPSTSPPAESTTEVCKLDDWLAGHDLTDIEPAFEAWRRDGALSAGMKIVGYAFFHDGEGGAWKPVAASVVERCATEPEFGLALQPQALEVAAAWEQAIVAHPQTAQVLANAATYFRRSPRRRDLAEKAVALEPHNPGWQELLASTYDKPGDREANENALGFLQRAEASANERFYLLDRLAQTALAAGEENEARRYAEESIAEAANHRGDWNEGNAIYNGHMVLGQLALAHDDIATAKAELLLAGQAPTSPQLRSAGGSMKLVKALLDRGERGVVLSFFDEATLLLRSECVSLWRQNIANGEPLNGEQCRFALSR